MIRESEEAAEGAGPLLLLSRISVEGADARSRHHLLGGILTKIWRTFSPLCTRASHKEKAIAPVAEEEAAVPNSKITVMGVRHVAVEYACSIPGKSLLMSFLWWIFWKINSKEKRWVYSMGAYVF